MIDVIYLPITHPQWQELSIKTMQKNFLKYNDIYTLEPNQTLYQFLESIQTTQQVLIIEQNMGFLKYVNIQNIPITYDFRDNIYFQDHLKPQLINRETFLKLPKKDYQFPLTQYFKSIDRVGIPNTSFVVYVNKPVCCTTKSLLTIKQYVKWNEKGFESLKKYLSL